MKDLMAASRMFLEPAALPRLVSRWFRKFTISGASNCSRLQFRGREFDAMAGVFEQKPEGMRIGVACVGAGAPFDGQALLEKGRDVRGEKDHGRPPAKKLWHESAMFLIRSGVASRYQ